MPFNQESASLEYLNLGYIVTDMNHDVLLINRAGRELLESTNIATLEEIVTHLPDRLQLLDHVKYCSVEHKSCSFREVELGSKKVRVFLSPVFDGGDLKGNLLTIEDITERGREQFLSFLVHELRTPLTAIRSNSALIEEYYPEVLGDQSLKEIVSDIHTGSKYVLEMVNQFLDMSRLEEGRIQFDLQQFDAGEVITQTVQSLQVLAREKGLDLSLAMPPNTDTQVAADPNRTKQVLTNLIGNALKFTEKGSVKVSVSATDTVVKVSVMDTGAGIPEESRANMFQKYFQASNNKLVKDSSKSTGIGLYVTKLLVQGMGGEISLGESKENEGSTFIFTIPLTTPARLKQVEKELYDAKQGVQHAQVSEHTSSAV
jgi:two-component system sensor histidine kinase ResE